MSERIAAMLQGLESTSSKVLEESRKQSESLEQIVLNLTNSVQQSMGSVTSAVSTTVNDLMAKTSATTDAARDNIDRLIGANQASLSELQHAQTTLRDTLSAFDGAMNGVRETARQLDSAGKLFEQSGEEIKAGASALSSHSSFLKSIFSDFKSVVESLEAENRRIQQLNGEYPRIFSEIDSSLASILKQIEERTEVYNQSMRKGVGETVSSLDNHLQRATKTFGDTIEDLEDKFSDLSELLEKLLRRK
jgi:chromosome segregation ATPase